MHLREKLKYALCIGILVFGLPISIIYTAYEVVFIKQQEILSKIVLPDFAILVLSFLIGLFSWKYNNRKHKI